jgi:hypothetical protein
MEQKNPFTQIVKKQIGRTPKENFQVVRLCRYGFPQVIKNPPVVDGKPFPTMFWLTCPHLVKKVSRLEEAGMISYFENKLKYDQRFRNRYLKAQQFERMLRKVYIPETLPIPIKKKLLPAGIGGIENPLGVKCLHLHLASYLGGVPNPIGEEVYKRVLPLECPNNYCQQAFFDKFKSRYG